MHRLKTWATATPSNSVYAEKAGGATDLDTLPRTLEHDDQYVRPLHLRFSYAASKQPHQQQLYLQLSAEWLSTGTVVHQPPSNRVGDLVTFKNIPSSGPREAAEMAQLLSIAETMVPKPPPPFKELTSTHRQDFVQHDTSGIVYVPRSVQCVLGVAWPMCTIVFPGLRSTDSPSRYLHLEPLMSAGQDEYR